jgi:hypothetical protein
MRGVTFVLGATWLALNVWVGEHAALLCAVAATALGSCAVRRPTRRPAPVETAAQLTR